jgi:hypothetical protein
VGNRDKACRLVLPDHGREPARRGDVGAYRVEAAELGVAEGDQEVGADPPHLAGQRRRHAIGSDCRQEEVAGDHRISAEDAVGTIAGDAAEHGMRRTITSRHRGHHARQQPQAEADDAAPGRAEALAIGHCGDTEGPGEQQPEEIGRKGQQVRRRAAVVTEQRPAADHDDATPPDHGQLLAEAMRRRTRHGKKAEPPSDALGVAAQHLHLDRPQHRAQIVGHGSEQRFVTEIALAVDADHGDRLGHTARGGRRRRPWCAGGGGRLVVGSLPAVFRAVW